MRMLALAILTIATISATSSARAQTYNPKYPVCLKIIEMFGGERYECAYTPWSSALRPHWASPPSVSSIRFTRREDAIGSIAVPIEPYPA